jgi:16S rRNA C1402 N4-methylase RsmH
MTMKTLIVVLFSGVLTIVALPPSCEAYISILPSRRWTSGATTHTPITSSFTAKNTKYSNSDDRHQWHRSSRPLLFAAPAKAGALDGNIISDNNHNNQEDVQVQETAVSSDSESSEARPPTKTRRIRYNGKYPRNFNDKYKELSGDEATVQKVLNKGMTPAGRHVPILLNECLQHLGLLELDVLETLDVDDDDSNAATSTPPTSADDADADADGPQPTPPRADADVDGPQPQPTLQPTFYVDCTLGYGGHSSQVLRRLLLNVNDNNNNNSKEHMKDHHRMVCFDRDPVELTKATERLNNQILQAHAHDNHNDNDNVDSDSQDDTTTSATASASSSTKPPVTVTTVNRNFRDVRSYLETSGDIGEGEGMQKGEVTALLADLGLSSMQIDDAARGFTYKREGPLDMRMAGAAGAGNKDEGNNTNTTDTKSSGSGSTSITAYHLLSRLTVKQLTKMLQENSDEEYAVVIAQAILGKPTISSNNNSKRQTQQRSRSKQKQNNRQGHIIPSTTVELANVVRDAVRPLISPPPPPSKKKANAKTNNAKAETKNAKATMTGGDPPPPVRRPDSAKVRKQLDSTVARVMQAIRIEVNSEFESLEKLLEDLPHILASPGGRAVVLTFHSGEDRRVKRAFKQGFKDGIYSSWSRDVVRPSAQERRENPRSSCCKLRWVVRSDKQIQKQIVDVATSASSTTVVPSTTDN